MVAFSTEHSNWVKAERLGTWLELQVHFVIGEEMLYKPFDREIQVPLDALISQNPIACAKIFHEIGHAWQHKKFSILLFLLGWNYWVRLFIEWHASRLALRWMKKYFSDEQIVEAKKELSNALKTYR